MCKVILVVATQIFVIFTPNLGEDFQFDEHIFRDGLVQPPTSHFRENFQIIHLKRITRKHHFPPKGEHQELVDLKLVRADI